MPLNCLRFRYIYIATISPDHNAEPIQRGARVTLEGYSSDDMQMKPLLNFDAVYPTQNGCSLPEHVLFFSPEFLLI